jgi:hypothetical protein
VFVICLVKEDILAISSLLAQNPLIFQTSKCLIKRGILATSFAGRSRSSPWQRHTPATVMELTTARLMLTERHTRDIYIIDDSTYLSSEVFKNAFLADSMLQTQLFPELHTDLVPTLSYLQCYNLSRHLCFWASCMILLILLLIVLLPSSLSTSLLFGFHSALAQLVSCILCLSLFAVTPPPPPPPPRPLPWQAKINTQSRQHSDGSRGQQH